MTLFSGKFFLGCLVRLTSCTGFIMMSYIVARCRFLFAVYKLRRTYLLQISEAPCLNPQTKFAITFTIEVCIVKFMAICNLWAHLHVRYVVSLGNTVVVSGCYPTNCQITPFEVHINQFISKNDG